MANALAKMCNIEREVLADALEPFSGQFPNRTRLVSLILLEIQKSRVDFEKEYNKKDTSTKRQFLVDFVRTCYREARDYFIDSLLFRMCGFGVPSRS
jgi:hypothetical protein